MGLAQADASAKWRASETMKYETFLSSPGAPLSAMGIAVLAYRAYLTLGGQFGYQVWEVAMLAAVRFASNDQKFASGLGLGEVLDFDRLRSFLRQRVDAEIGVLLVIGGMALSLGGLLFPGDNPERSVIVGAFVVGLLLAWGLTKGYGCLWRWRRERWWLAHVWLAWLEGQIADPLSPSGSAQDDLRLVAEFSPHPDLTEFIRKIRAGREFEYPQPEDVQAIERWIADFAAKWKHRFKADAWNEWHMGREKHQEARGTS